MLLGVSVRRALRKLEIDSCDVLLLGWWNSAPPQRILDAARRLRDAGTVKHIALSTHHRPLVAELGGPKSDYDVIHVRYNATHRGAEKEVFAQLPEARDSRAGLVAFTATRWGNLLAPVGLPAGVATPTAGDCYRFCLTQRHVDLVMAGAQNEKQVHEALDRLDKGPMSADELKWIQQVGDHVRATTSSIRGGT